MTLLITRHWSDVVDDNKDEYSVLTVFLILMRTFFVVSLVVRYVRVVEVEVIERGRGLR